MSWNSDSRISGNTNRLLLISYCNMAYQSILPKDGWTFLSQLSQICWGRLNVTIILMVNRLHFQIVIFRNLSIMISTELREQEWINISQTFKGVKNFSPIYFYENLVSEPYHIPAYVAWNFCMMFFIQDTVWFLQNEETQYSAPSTPRSRYPFP